MVGLICLEGLGPSYPESFMRKLAREWAYGPAEYVDNEDGLNIDRKASWAMYHTLKYFESYPDLNGLIVAGYSQGGAAAIKYAHELKKYGWRLDLLALFDAVSRDPYGGNGVWFDPLIPDNVKATVHAMRNPATLSRPAWGNCGRSAPNDYWSKYFWVTHGGASGCDYLAYPSGPPNPDKIVWETLMGGRGWGKEHYTLVTEGQDWRGAGELWQWMYPTIKTFGQHLNLSGESPWVEDAPKGNSTPKPANGGNGKPPTTGGNTYQVVKGDSLSLISGRFYGDVLLWPVIWDRNKAVVGNNPNLIYPGQRLTIPSISAYNQSQLSSIRQRGRNC